MIMREAREDLVPAYLEMCAEYRAAGEAHYSQVDSQAKALERLARDRSPGPGKLPSLSYWFLDDSGTRLLGTARLRPQLSGRFFVWGGHVGYDLRPTARGQGLGTLILSLVMDEARQMGLPRLLVTCDADNLPSSRVIEKNGGRLESLARDDQGTQVRRYWIELGRGGLGPILLDSLPMGLPLVEDHGEAMVDLRGLHPRLKVDETRSQISSRSPHFTWARTGVAAALATACETLPEGLFLLLKEAYRPPERQALSWEACLEASRKASPRATEEELRRLTCLYVAPLELAGHPTGGALDLSLADASGELFMGTEFNAEPLESGRRTFLDSRDIDPEARSLREALAACLEGAGFINYPSEWWHWSMGDPYWAFVKARPVRYGPVKEGEL